MSKHCLPKNKRLFRLYNSGKEVKFPRCCKYSNLYHTSKSTIVSRKHHSYKPIILPSIPQLLKNLRGACGLGRLLAVANKDKAQQRKGEGDARE